SDRGRHGARQRRHDRCRPTRAIRRHEELELGYAGTGTRRAALLYRDQDGADQSMTPSSMRVVDSHTEGEPTRVIVDGWPQPVGDTMEARRESLRRDADALRRAVVCEPRGHAAIVGALLTPPVCAGSLAGIVFFNNETCLGMCG